MKCNYCCKRISRNLTLKELFLPLEMEPEQLCFDCERTFQKLEKRDSCPTCQKQGIYTYCEDCFYWKERYPSYSFQHEALFSYNEAMKEWMHEYKFKGNYCLRGTFSTQLKKYFSTKKNNIIIPIPLSDERIQTRGFNQVEGMLEAAKVPYASYLLRKEDGSRQSEKNQRDRMLMKQPFCLKEDRNEPLANRSILLVDDIYTTGRTLFYAAELFLLEHPLKIRTFSLAR